MKILTTSQNNVNVIISCAFSALNGLSLYADNYYNQASDVVASIPSLALTAKKLTNGAVGLFLNTNAIYVHNHAVWDDYVKQGIYEPELVFNPLTGSLFMCKKTNEFITHKQAIVEIDELLDKHAESELKAAITSILTRTR